MRWWDDLWLNEGFADWLGPKIADQVYPQFGIANDQVASLQGTLSTDARPSAPAVRRPVARSKDVFTNADLTYAKGRAVLAMVEQWLSPEVFRQGVRAYVAAHPWGNAGAADLWQALDEASHQDVAGVMGSFLDQPGAPLLTVDVVDADRGIVEIAQQRFVALGSQATEEHWKVPVVLTWSDGKRRETRPVLLAGAKGRYDLGGPVAWIFPNGGGRGYYRWRIPPAALTELAAAAPERLDVRERIALLGNAAALLDAGHLGGDSYLGVVQAAAADSDPDVLDAVLEALGRIKASFVDEALEDPFASYVRRTLAPVLGRIGELPRAGEPVAVGLLRPKLLGWLGEDGRDPEVRALATRLAGDYFRDPRSVDPGLVGTTLEIAAIEGDEARFETYRRRFEGAESSEERLRFLAALGKFRRPELEARALAYTIAGPLRPQELRMVPFALSSDIGARDRLFAWVTESWAPLSTRLPPDRVASLTRFAGGCSTERLAAARAFFAAPERKSPAIDVQMARVADQVGECVALRGREGPRVGTWLRAAARTS
jgi:alanyl aminopeptidase